MAAKVSPPKPEPDYKAVADAIARVGDAAHALNASGLTRTAVVALIHDATGLAKRDIMTVMNAQESLTRWCLKQ